MTTILTVGNSNTGYNHCTCDSTNRGLAYRSHEGGAKSRWLDVIRQINNGNDNLSYVTAAGDCLPVAIQQKQHA